MSDCKRIASFEAQQLRFARRTGAKSVVSVVQQDPGTKTNPRDVTQLTPSVYTSDRGENSQGTISIPGSDISQTGPRSGKVDGTLSLMGKTRPVTFDVELVGAGKGFAGQPRMGMNARTTINHVDFGLPPFFGDAIEIVVDAEFQRNP